MNFNLSRSECADILRAANLQISSQRIEIYKHLYQNRIHPTADTLYRSLATENPSLSKTTIYNTLKAFEAHNLLQPLIIEDGELRYDVNIAPHAHFKCLKCGLVMDIFYQEKPRLPEVPAGYQVTEEHICLRGFCPDCHA
ncbi:MAG: Fur family transcriptional regulator [Victivallaceae bacterium]